MSRTQFQPQDIHEPTHNSVGPNGLASLAERALCAAESVLGVTRPPIGRRDTRGVRGLAAYVLKREHGDRFSWPDVCEALYGNRGHSTAITAAHRWRGKAAAATNVYRSGLRGTQ